MKKKKDIISLKLSSPDSDDTIMLQTGNTIIVEKKLSGPRIKAFN